MADPLSITTACLSLLGSITKLSTDLTAFVSTARDARKDIDGFLKELSSLKLCVDTLKDEDFPFPESLQKQLSDVLANCNATVKDMEAIVKAKSSYHNAPNTGDRSSSSPRFTGKIKWSFKDRDEVVRLRGRLEALKSTLEIALDMATLVMVAAVRQDTLAVRTDTSLIREDTTLIRSSTSAIHDDTSAMREELTDLRMQVMRLNVQSTGPVMLARFLNDTLEYTESVVDPSENADSQCETVVDPPVVNNALQQAAESPVGPSTLMSRQIPESTDIGASGPKMTIAEVDSIPATPTADFKPHQSNHATMKSARPNHDGQDQNRTASSGASGDTASTLVQTISMERPAPEVKENLAAKPPAITTKTSTSSSSISREAKDSHSSKTVTNITTKDLATRFYLNGGSSLSRDSRFIHITNKQCPIFPINSPTNSCSCSQSLIRAIKAYDLAQCASLLKYGAKVFYDCSNVELLRTRRGLAKEHMAVLELLRLSGHQISDEQSIVKYMVYHERFDFRSQTTEGSLNVIDYLRGCGADINGVSCCIPKNPVLRQDIRKWGFVFVGPLQIAATSQATLPWIPVLVQLGARFQLQGKPLDPDDELQSPYVLERIAGAAIKWTIIHDNIPALKALIAAGARPSRYDLADLYALALRCVYLSAKQKDQTKTPILARAVARRHGLGAGKLNNDPLLRLMNNTRTVDSDTRTVDGDTTPLFAAIAAYGDEVLLALSKIEPPIEPVARWDDDEKFVYDRLIALKTGSAQQLQVDEAVPESDLHGLHEGSVRVGPMASRTLRPGPEHDNRGRHKGFARWLLGR